MTLPVPVDTVRCNLVWDLGENEIAVNSFHFAHDHKAGNTLDWEGDMTQRYANLLHDAMIPVKSTIVQMLPTTTQALRVDAYHLQEDGKADIKKSAPFTVGENYKGSASGVSLPKECSVVVSLYGYPIGAYDPQGARKRGRIYMPAPSTGMCGTNGRFIRPAELGVAWSTILSYMTGRPMDNLALAPNGHEQAWPIVLSRKFTVGTRIKQVRCDDLFDVQRRRQNALIPAVYSTAVTPVP